MHEISDLLLIDFKCVFLSRQRKNCGLDRNLKLGKPLKCKVSAKDVNLRNFGNIHFIFHSILPFLHRASFKLLHELSQCLSIIKSDGVVQRCSNPSDRAMTFQLHHFLQFRLLKKLFF